MPPLPSFAPGTCANAAVEGCAIASLRVFVNESATFNAPALSPTAALAKPSERTDSAFAVVSCTWFTSRGLKERLLAPIASITLTATVQFPAGGSHS